MLQITIFVRGNLDTGRGTFNAARRAQELVA